MAEAHAQAVAGSLWAGGVRPYAMGTKKLGMWLFIIADALTFSVLILAYAYIRLASPDWPKPFAFSPAIVGATLMTFFLLSSSLTMVMAVAAAHRQEHKRAVRYLLLTMLGGIAFIVLHAREWLHLIHDGVRPFSNPGWPAEARVNHGTAVTVSAIYWHCLGVLWVFLFLLLLVGR